MPDPFDIYSGEKPTFGSNIRWGMSGDSMVSGLVPDLAMAGTGALLSTYGLRRLSGSPFITPGASKWYNGWLGGLTKTPAEDALIKSAFNSKTTSSIIRDSKLIRAGNVLKTLGVWYGVAQLATGVASMSRAIGNSINSAQPRYNVRAPAQFTTSFFDTSGAYTMRQRSISAIHNSQLSTRASLGNESSFMHV